MIRMTKQTDYGFVLLGRLAEQPDRVANAPELAAETRPVELHGPVVDPQGRTDVVSNQSEVDDLLASLGF